MKNSNKKILVLTVLGFLYNGTYATCTLKEISGDWTKTLSFSCDEDIDLTQRAIEFTIDQGKINAVWDLRDNTAKKELSAPVTISQDERNIKVQYGQYWWPEEDVILPKGHLASFTFSSTENNLNITEFHVQSSQPEETSLLLFEQANDSHTLPNDTVIELMENGVIAYRVTWKSVKTQGLNVTPGRYSISAYVKKDDIQQPVAIVSANPVTAVKNKSQIVTLKYQLQDSQLKFSLLHEKPQGISNNVVSVTIEDKNSVSDSQTLDVPWGADKTITLAKDKTYRFSTEDITGSMSVYHFTFSPTEVTLENPSTIYSVSMNVTETPIITYPVFYTISGLPTGSKTTLTLSQAGKVIDKQEIEDTHGEELKVNLPVGSYEVDAASITIGDYQYSLKPQTVVIQNCQSCNHFVLQFDKNEAHPSVKGWPNYIAMGAVTDANFLNPTQFRDRPVDAIFKYAGDGGNGDPGMIIYPIYTQNTYKLAQVVTEQNKRVTRPVMVIYTAEMSGGTSFKDFDNSKSEDELQNLILTKHFINLMLEAQTIQAEGKKYDLPGSIILNPDLMGMIQQMSLYKDLLDPNSPTFIDVKNALQQAYWFVTTAHNWTIMLNNGKTLNINNKTPEGFFQIAENGSLKPDVYSPWDVKKPWEENAIEILKDYKGQTAQLPNFSDDFKGWIQASNWVIKNFAPDISFGWQENVWNVIGANWLHKDLTEQQVEEVISNSTIKLWQDAGLYTGAYKPDFLVFDKYERNPIPGEVGAGFVWNSRDWNNYLTYVKQLSEGLGKVPVMLWQLPGGHLQTTDELDQGTHGATAPDYFLGNPVVKKDLSNLQSYIKNITLQKEIYDCEPACQLPQYLLSNGQMISNYDWSRDNMDKAQQSHVFAILWGGGSTTSVGTFPMDDGGWLATQIKRYYNNPQPV